MAEHLVKIPCHIVFILKLYCKFLLGLFRCPADLQLAPLPEELCSSGNAADLSLIHILILLLLGLWIIHKLFD